MVGEAWAWWPQARESVRVLAAEELWGQRLVDVLSPAQRRVFRVDPDSLKPLAARPWTQDELVWRAAALRALALAMTGEPLAMRSGGVQLLPHQLSTLTGALGMDPVRLAVCDEVGLGKTITAGAIASELRARRRVQRVLVVAPKGVQLQWIAEMRDRFGEDYVRVGPEGVPIDDAFDVWRAFDRVVTSVDAVKPLRSRAGWTADQVRKYNEQRFLALVQAGWDLVILDEAHHVAGSDESVARHRLARELAANSPHLLLLSATPHSGKSDSFRRFLGLIEPAFLAGRPVNRETVVQVVARTDKRSAVDDQGRPLFQPRTTHIELVPWGEHVQHQLLYEEVTAYVRDGYASAKATGRTATGFLMLLLQRLLASSTPAILSALERRLAALTDMPATTSQLDLEDWLELTGEEQDAAIGSDTRPVVAQEVARLEGLVERARRCHSLGPDPKTLHFLKLLRRLRREENNPRLKVLVFTEFRATQQMLAQMLEGQGIRTAIVNGQMGLQERAIAQQRFREDAEVLISTDAGGEGINLQFAHIVVNWDLPWAPTRIEQRIGRVDRIGQQHPVRAFNLVLEDSVDLRVLQVLEDKLGTIEQELGADKRADILDSADRLVDEVFTQAIIDPASLASAADDFGRRLREDIAAAEDARQLLQPTTHVVLKRQEPQLPTVLRAAAQALASLKGAAVKDTVDALRGLPVVAPGEPVPVIAAEADGWLSLWLVNPSDATDQMGAYAVFHSATGRVDPHHAERIWRELCRQPSIVATEIPDEATWIAIVEQGRDFGYAPLQQLTHGDRSLPRIELALLVKTVR
jgi:superfamily II DNA or RNA helicase